MRTTVKAIVCGAVLLVLAGCSDKADTEVSERKLCLEVAQLDGAVTQLAALPPDATTGQVQALKTRIDEEYQDVQEAGEDVKNVGIDNITATYNRVTRAISTATSQGVAAADAEIDQAAADLNQARTTLNQAVGC